MFRALDCFAIDETLGEMCLAVGAQAIDDTATTVFEFDYGKSCVWRVKSNYIVGRDRRKVAGDRPFVAHLSS
jgi:hypothetical protein